MSNKDYQNIEKGVKNKPGIKPDLFIDRIGIHFHVLVLHLLFHYALH